MKHSVEEKWFWMMNWYKKNVLPPAQAWAWDKVEVAYQAALKAAKEW